MGRTVVVRLVTGKPANGQLAARLHDVETGVEQVVCDAGELVAALHTLAQAHNDPPPGPPPSVDVPTHPNLPREAQP